MSLLPYPLLDECQVNMEVSATTGLQLVAWELRLQHDASSDPQTGTYSKFEFPENIGVGFAAIVWNGLVTFKDPAYVPPRAPANQCSRRHTVVIPSGMEVSLRNAEYPARVAIIGCVGPESAALIDAMLPRRGECSAVPLHMPEFPSDLNMAMLVRPLGLTKSSPATDEETLECWPRPGFFLTTTDGPQVIDPCEVAQADTELKFIALPACELKDIPITRNELGRNQALIIDFYAEGDDVDPRAPDSGEGGCRIRCWSGGGVEEIEKE